MMNKRKDEIIRGICQILKKNLQPHRIILFGSRAKKGNQAPSDFDFAVDCPRPPLSLERQINEEIGQISGLYRVDIVYLESVDKEFRKIILKTGKVMYNGRED